MFASFFAPIGENLCNAQDLQGLLDDAARLEKTGSLSQATASWQNMKAWALNE